MTWIILNNVTAHSTKDVQGIDTASEKLNETWSAISTRLYQQSQEEPQNESSDTEKSSGEVEDADFEEVK